VTGVHVPDEAQELLLITSLHGTLANMAPPEMREALEERPGLASRVPVTLCEYEDLTPAS